MTNLLTETIIFCLFTLINILTAQPQNFRRQMLLNLTISIVLRESPQKQPITKTNQAYFLEVLSLKIRYNSCADVMRDVSGVEVYVMLFCHSLGPQVKPRASKFPLVSVYPFLCPFPQVELKNRSSWNFVYLSLMIIGNKLIQYNTIFAKWVKESGKVEHC